MSSRDYITVLYLMCKKMLIEADPGEDPQCHAAKLLEVIILQCKCQGHNINELIPSFIEVAFIRLSREIKTSELRTMCIQVSLQSFSLRCVVGPCGCALDEIFFPNFFYPLSCLLIVILRLRLLLDGSLNNQ